MVRISWQLMLTLTALTPGSLYAHETFNPHALEIDNPGQSVGDLSVFAQQHGQQPGVYWVTVWVNGARQEGEQGINFTQGQDNKLIAQITPTLLEAWGVKMKDFPLLASQPANQPLNDISVFIPMASTRLDFSRLQLDVSIPQVAMKASVRGWEDPSQWDDGVPAALLNYSMSGSNTWRDKRGSNEKNYYANLNSGINVGAWRLRNDSTWNNDNNKGWTWDTINTYLQRDIRALKGQLTVGDNWTPSDIFDSVQFRGAQLASDDNMLPDSLRGFAPVIRGIAQSNAQVTIKQHGYVIYQTYVAAGAFAISDLYPTSGSGDLEVIIKEADGSQRRFVQPFSAVPVMQREGRLKYAITAGKFRSNMDDSDAPLFSQITAMYGLPYAITVYGGTLYSDFYRSGVTGTGMSLGTLGSLSADVTVANSSTNNHESHSGQSYRFQYSKDIQTTNTHFSLAAYRYSTKGFYTFQEANDSRINEVSDGLANNKRQRLQWYVNQTLGDHGSLFISGYQQDYWHMGGYERTFSAGWNSSLNGINYNIAWTYTDDPENIEPADQQLAFSVQVPLSLFLPAQVLDNAWTSYSVNTGNNRDIHQQAGLNGTLLNDNNLSYSIQHSNTNPGAGSSGSINSDFKGGYGEISGGYNYDNHTRQINYGLKGGIVGHPYGITFSQPLGQSLAVVKAPGADNTKVQNNAGVYTDWRGYAVVPYVSPYRKNRIALDTSTLGDEVDIETAVQTVIPTQGAVVMVDFDTRIGNRVLMTLIYRGLPVPFGALAELDSGGNGIVGDDGQLYLTGVPEEGKVSVSWSGTESCVVHFHLPIDEEPSSLRQTEQDCR